MGALDPATAAANRAALAARSDYVEAFACTAAATARRWVPHALQAVFRPVTASVLLVSWSTVYKGAPWGDGFVCDASMEALATAALLDHAVQVLDTVDLRRAAFGLSSPVFTS